MPSPRVLWALPGCCWWPWQWPQALGFAPCLASPSMLPPPRYTRTAGQTWVPTAQATRFLQLPTPLLLQVLPFLALGIGVDDIFLLAHAFTEAPPGTPLQVQLHSLALGSSEFSIGVKSFLVWVTLG